MSRMIAPRRAAALAAPIVALALVLGAGAPAPVQAKETPGSFADLAERLLPSVVNISTTQVITQERRGPEQFQFPPGSPFEEFFREFFERGERGEGRPQQRQRRATSLGSGFIIDAEGYVVTNNHVIAEADEISVTLHDNSVYKAEVVGRDPQTDLALLKIETERTLSAVGWGDSERARVGDWVIAIGNPFGLGGTVTAGIISARARDIQAGPYDDFIQTDASINRGNSGGPMFDMDGRVIGVNTAIYSPSGGSVGIGFAIPSSLAEQVVDSLREFGRTRRGWLGVRIQTVTDEIAESLGMERARGALVASVTEGGPAEAAGIRPGDVVLRFDGREVEEMRRLPRIVAETRIGKVAEVDLWRDGQTVTVEVEVGELRDEVVAARPEEPSPEPSEPTATLVESLGMELAALDDTWRDRFGLSADTRGVVIVDMDPDGGAAERGLRPGDVITEVNQQQVRTPEDVKARVEEASAAGRQSVLLLVETDSGLRFVPLRIAG